MRLHQILSELSANPAKPLLLIYLEMLKSDFAKVIQNAAYTGTTEDDEFVNSTNGI